MIVIFSHAQIVTKVRKQNGFINQQFIIFFNNSPNHEHTECNGVDLVAPYSRIVISSPIVSIT